MTRDQAEERGRMSWWTRKNLRGLGQEWPRFREGGDVIQVASEGRPDLVISSLEVARRKGRRKEKYIKGKQGK